MAERTLEEFEAARRARWVELARLVEAGPRSRRGTPDAGVAIARTLVLVRLVSGDLAWARRRFAGTAVVGELEVLLTAARPLLARPPRQAREVLLDGVRLVGAVLQRSRGSVLVASALLLVAIALGAVGALVDPVGAEVVLSLDARIPPEPGDPLPAVTGLPVGTPASGTSWSVAAAGGAAVLAVVGGALVGVGTIAVLLLWGLRLGVGATLALRGDQAARVLEGLGASGLALLAVLVLGAAAGFTAAAGIAGRRPLAEAATDAAVLAALGLAPLVPAVLGAALARTDPVVGAVVGLLGLVVVVVGLAALTRAAPTPRTPPPPPRRAPAPTR